MSTELCAYGCGNAAKHTLGNGKSCCAVIYQRCPSFRAISQGRMREILKVKHQDVTPESSLKKKQERVKKQIQRNRERNRERACFVPGSLCFYGCGGAAAYPIVTRPGFGMCSRQYGKCPAARKRAELTARSVNLRRFGPDYDRIRVEKDKAKNSRNAKRRTQNKHEVAGFPEGSLCMHGCGNPALYPSIRHPGLGRCSKRYHGCRAARAHRKEVYESTLTQRYGIRSPFMDREKIRETMLRRYGVPHTGNLPEVRAKFLATVRKRYGADHPMQNPDFFDHHRRNRLRLRKRFILPSGRILTSLQGYEPWALEILLRNYDEEQFDFDQKVSVPYVGVDGRRHLYYPDFVLPGICSLVEVKSSYFMQRDRIEIRRKAEAAANQGWEVLFAIGSQRPAIMRLVPFRLLQSTELPPV